MPWSGGGAGEESSCVKESGKSQGKLKESGERGEMAKWSWSPRKGNCFGLEAGGEVTVVDEREAEGEGEEIKKGVVACEGDQEHEGEETEGGGEADFGLGK